MNPVENIWQHLRQTWLSNRVFEDYKAILDAGCDAWNKLIAKPRKTIGFRTPGDMLAKTVALTG